MLWHASKPPTKKRKNEVLRHASTVGACSHLSTKHDTTPEFTTVIIFSRGIFICPYFMIAVYPQQNEG